MSNKCPFCKKKSNGFNIMYVLESKYTHLKCILKNLGDIGDVLLRLLKNKKFNSKLNFETCMNINNILFP